MSFFEIERGTMFFPDKFWVVITSAMSVIAIIMLGIDMSSYAVPVYEAGTVPATVVRFNYEANVRADPGVLSVEEGPTNYLGSLEESDFTIEVSSGTLWIQEDVFNDANGDFYGFSVEDIMATPEGRAWFPKEIEKDEDGIIWVNSQYVDIIDSD